MARRPRKISLEHMFFFTIGTIFESWLVTLQSAMRCVGEMSRVASSVESRRATA